jgi:hypothetical protein
MTASPKAHEIVARWLVTVQSGLAKGVDPGTSTPSAGSPSLALSSTSPGALRLSRLHSRHRRFPLGIFGPPAVDTKETEAIARKAIERLEKV